MPAGATLPSQAHAGGHPARVLIASTTAFTLVIAGTTVVNIALPAIHRDFGTSLAGLQWVINLYTLMLAGLLLTMGSQCDRRGARTIMLVGVGLFVTGAGVATVAPDLLLLLSGQALLGSGAAALLPASLALISDAYPDNHKRARAISIYAAASAAAIGVGPVIGGLLIDAIGWRAIFAFDVPVALSIGLLVIKAVPTWTRERPQRLDLPGQVTAVLGLGALTFAVIDSGTHGWGARATWVPMLLAIVIGRAFITAERRADTPMLSLAIFRSTAFNASAVAGLLFNFGVYGQFFVLSLYLQNLRGRTPLETGLIFLVQPTIAAATALIGGAIASRRGARIPVLVGGGIAALGTAMLTVLTPHSSYLLVVAGLLLLGCGGGLGVPALTVAVVSASARSAVGVATATFTASRQIGGILGVAVLGAAVGEPLSLSGLHTAIWIAAAALAVGGLLGLCVSRTAAGRPDGLTASDGAALVNR